jgi:hypothetical protein
MQGVKTIPEGTGQKRLWVLLTPDDLSTLTTWAQDSYRTPCEQASFLLHDILRRKREGPGPSSNGAINSISVTPKPEGVHRG